MKRVKRNGVLAVVLLLLLATAAIVLAQSSARFELQQHVFGGGGGEASSASYQVNGTVGQALAGDRSTSGTFLLDSGFWVQEPRRKIYLPVIVASQTARQSRSPDRPGSAAGPVGTGPARQAP